MGKFYDSYKSLHEEANNAVSCKKSSELAGDVNKIISNLKGLNLEWKDSVTSEFYSYVGSCVEYLTKILSSIESELSSAESAYVSLKEKLDKLYEDDRKYQQLCNNEPKEQTVIDHDELGKAIYGETSEHARWRKDKSDLATSCGQIVIEIQEYIRVLNQVNTVKISNDVGDSSLGLTVPEFNMSDGIFITNTSDLEKMLESISSDPSKCRNIVNLKDLGVIDAIGTTSEHTFMGWQRDTDETSNQVRLRNTVYPDYDKYSSDYYDSEGFARIGDRYVVATTTTYGNVGDYIDIEQADGSVIKAIIGDIKNQNDKGCTPYGHNGGKCVVEFVVDCNTWYQSNWKDGNHENPGTPTCHPEWHQDVVEIRNLGNYFDYADQYETVRTVA